MAKTFTLTIGTPQHLAFDMALCKVMGLKRGDRFKLIRKLDGSVKMVPLRRVGRVLVTKAMIQRATVEIRRNPRRGRSRFPR
jgi:hypothetical protein